MNNKVTLQEIIDAIVEKTDHKKIFINDYIHELINAIKEGLQRDGHVNITGLGIFKLNWVKTQNMRNPRTGENIEVPAHSKIHFRPDKKMRIFVNRKYNHLNPKEIVTKKSKKKEGEIMKDEINVEDKDVNDVPTAQDKPKEDIITKKPPKKFPYIPVIGSLIIILIIFLLFQFLNRQEKKPDHSVPPKLEMVKEKDTVKKDKSIAIAEKKKEPTIKKTETTYKETSIIHHVISGNTLWGLADKYYENAPLWPNIYRKNMETVSNPDIILSGKSIEVPNLEGTGYNLTKRDSFNIAEGYYLSYLAYKKCGNEKASEFLRIAKRFNTTVEKNKK